MEPHDQQERQIPSTSRRSQATSQSPRKATEGIPVLLDDDAKVTIHPRIQSHIAEVGSQVARQRHQKINAFWAVEVELGLPVAMALGGPDEHGMYGPWTGKMLAQKLRLLVAQLIEFQIQHDEVPGHLQVLGKSISEISSLPSKIGGEDISDIELAPTEIFSLIVDQGAEQGFANVGFGGLRIFQQIDQSAASFGTDDPSTEQESW